MPKLIVCILLNLCVVSYVAASVYFPLKYEELKRLVRSPNPHQSPCKGFPSFPGPPPPPPPPPPPYGDCSHGGCGHSSYPEFQGNAQFKSHDTSGDTEIIGNKHVQQNLPSAALISPGGNHETGSAKATATAHAEAQSEGSASAQASAKATAVSHNQSKICYYCTITDNSK